MVLGAWCWVLGAVLGAGCWVLRSSVLLSREPGRGHTGPQNTGGADVESGQREAAERPLEIVERQTGVEKGAEHHVAGDAGEAVEIEHS